MLTYRGDKFIKGKKFTINESVYRFQKRDNNDNLIFESDTGDKLKLTEDEFNDSVNKGKEEYHSVGDPERYILSVAEEYDVDFDNKTPFEYFYAPDSDDEDSGEFWYSDEYDWASFYDKILHDMGYGESPILNDCRAEVHEESDGEYELDLFINGEEHCVELNAWDKLEDVKKNVYMIINLLKDNK